jgi:hypothetical protein
VEYIGNDDIMKDRIDKRIGKLGIDNGINEFGDTGFIISIHNEEDMSVRKTPFLELDDIYISYDFIQYILLGIDEIFDEDIEFNFEYPGDDIWMILSGLIIFEKIDDFYP